MRANDYTTWMTGREDAVAVRVAGPRPFPKPDVIS
jgi:hypothetical protein